MSLMTHLWQSTLCAGIAALLAFGLRRTSAWTRHSIWLFASLKFLVPLPLMFAAGEYLGGWLTVLGGSDWPRAAWWLEAPVVRWTVASGSALEAGDRFLGSPVWSLALVTMWVIGSCALALRQCAAWRRISRIARAATPIHSGPEAEALHRLTARSSRPGVPLLRTSSQLEPGALGVFKPRILWPAGLSDRLDDGEIEAVLSHELCHIERRDNLVALVHMIVETIFWFHPVVWWIGARLIAERERACDERVVERGACRHAYAEGILKVCGFCLRSPLPAVPGVGGGSLGTRIERIMHRPASPSPRPVRLVLAALVVVATGMPLAAGVIAGREEPQKPREEKPAETKPYKPGPGIVSPKVLKETRPKYTPEAMKAKIQGRLMLEAIVLPDGTVDSVKVTKSLDATYGLDDEAVRALKQWRFTPGTKDDKPVPVLIEVEMTFTLGGR